MNRFIKHYISKLDEKIKHFFGLSHASEKLNSSLIINDDGEISIIINETYKRNYNKYKIDSFMQNQFHLLSSELKKKFGCALEEIIATDLVLAFDDNDKNPDDSPKDNKRSP